MSFTDDDYKRMKSHIECGLPIPSGMLSALFLRFEAAGSLIRVPIHSEAFKIREEAWRKAAGK